jgi:hypothetical protein
LEIRESTPETGSRSTGCTAIHSASPRFVEPRRASPAEIPAVSRGFGRGPSAIPNRRRLDGVPDRATSGLAVLEAIRLYTTHAAYVGFEEDTKGSIEAGKLADLVALSEDPFEIPVDRLKDVQVALTVVVGEVAYADGIEAG